MSADQAVRQIVRAGLIDEARRVAPRLAARMEPAGAEGVLALLVPLKAFYGKGERSEGEWAEFWSQYIKALGVLPAECIAEAIVLWNRTGDRFPAPGQLFKLAEAEATKLRIAAWRAKKAAEWRDEHPPQQNSAEDRAKIREMTAAMRGPDGRIRLGVPNSIPEPHRPAPGMTPQRMAEELRRRAAEDDGEAI